MKMHNLLSVLLFCAVTSSTTIAGAFDVAQSESHEANRIEYNFDSSLPDRYAFVHLLGRLGSVDEETASLILQAGLDIDSGESEKLLDALRKANTRLDRDIKSAQLQIGCLVGAPRVSGDDVYPVLEAMDDAIETQGAVQLEKFLERSGSKNSEKFLRWLDSEKSHISYIKFDQKELHRRSGKSGYATLTDLCNFLSNSPDH